MTRSLVTLRHRGKRAARERGATTVQYGLMVTLIAAVIVAMWATLGNAIQTALQHVVAKI